MSTHTAERTLVMAFSLLALGGCAGPGSGSASPSICGSGSSLVERLGPGAESVPAPGDWAQYGFDGGQSRNNCYERVLTAGRVISLTRLWTRETLPNNAASGGGGPAIAGGTLFAQPVTETVGVGTAQIQWILEGIDAETGTIRWQQGVDTLEGFGAPAVASGRLLAARGRSGSSSTRLEAIDLRSGAAVLWSQDATSLGSQIVLEEGTLFTGTDTAVMAIDPRTGATLWQSAASYPSIAVDGGLVFIAGLDGSLQALDHATGATVWRESGAGRANLSAGGGAVYLIQSANGQATLRALEGASGATLWQQPWPDELAMSAPAIGETALFIASMDGWLRALDRTTGSPLWTTFVGGRLWSAPALAAGVVYLGTETGVSAFDAGNGAVLWSDTTGERMTAPAVAQGRLYLMAGSGTAYAYGPSR